MRGYAYTTELEAIAARQEAATFKGLPKEGGTTLYWVDFNYSELDGFYYIQYVEGLFDALGMPIDFELTEA
jgi:hypothetical protein